eukprot:8106239-Karenia_brevis.AAC.1
MGLHRSAKVVELRNRYWKARREQKQSAKQKPSKFEAPHSESSTSATSGTLPTQLPYALEVFCGSGRLAHELQKEGFATIGFDHSGNKDKPQCRVG